MCKNLCLKNFCNNLDLPVGPRWVYMFKIFPHFNNVISHVPFFFLSCKFIAPVSLNPSALYSYSGPAEIQLI